MRAMRIIEIDSSDGHARIVSEVAGNLVVFLFATLSEVINLELYFSYYYFARAHSRDLIVLGLT